MKELGVTLKIKCSSPKSTVNRIYKKRYEFEERFGKKPNYIILGSKSYFNVVMYEQKSYGEPANAQWIGRFMDMDIILSEKQGIQLGFKNAFDMAPIFEHELMKKRKRQGP